MQPLIRVEPFKVINDVVKLPLRSVSLIG